MIFNLRLILKNITPAWLGLLNVKKLDYYGAIILNT